MTGFGGARDLRAHHMCMAAVQPTRLRVDPCVRALSPPTRLVIALLPSALPPVHHDLWRGNNHY
jgi:hypothetical protein